MKKQRFIAQLIQDQDPSNPRTEWDNLGHMICAHGRYNLGDEQSSAPYDMCGYESNEDNFLMWVFVEFIQGSKTVPEPLEGWSYDGYQPTLCKELASGSLVYLEDFIPKSFKEAIEKWIRANLCILPLYLFDHSGITMNTSGFSCGWDSGQVGYIYVTKETWLKEHDRDFVQEEAVKYLKAEVETYDQYLTGDVYGKVLHRIDDENFEESRNISIMESTPLYDLYMADYEFSVDEYEDTEELDACWGYYGREYAEQCCKEEFPDYCLSEALGDHCENYVISQEIAVNNGVISAVCTRVFPMPRKEALEFIQKIPEKLLHTFIVEPLAAIKTAPNKVWGYM